MLKKIKDHYHWIIAGVALLQLLIYGGAVNNYSGYHMIPVTEALGITRTAFSLSNSFRAVLSMVSTLFSGVLIRHFGYRKVASVGMACAGLAYVIYSTMNTFGMLMVGAGLMGLASGICSTAGVSRLINGWFHKYRGTVLGLVTAATGVGSTLLGFIQAAAIEQVSWRLSFMIVAWMQLALAVVLFLLVRNAPEDMGLRPYGDGQLSTGKKKETVRWLGFTMQELKKRPAFYLLIVCAFFSCMCVLATQYNLVPYFQDCGMSTTRTSRIYGIMMLLLGVVKLSMGALCDAIGAKRVTFICHGACAVGLTLVMLLPQTDIAMIGALIVIDLAIPLTTMMFPLLSVDLFGYQAQSQYIGIIMAMTSASNILSGPMANFVRDTQGSYRPVFWGCVILSTVLMGMYGILFAMVKRDKKQLEKQ